MTFRPKRRKPAGWFKWGYIRTNARYAGVCDSCEKEFAPNALIWWQPKIKRARCFCCEPREIDQEMDKVQYWLDNMTPEEWEAEFPSDELPDYSDEEREQLFFMSPGWCGVRWCEEDPETLDDDLEKEEDNEALSSGDGGDIPSISSLLRRDGLSARKVTDPILISSLPVEDVLADIEPLVNYHVRSIGSIDGRWHDDDLRSVAVEAALKALPRFSGRGAFGAFADAVVRNALTDALKKEKRAPLPFGDGGSVEVGNDPTDDWCRWIDLKSALLATEHADLVVRHGFGYHDRELGDPQLIKARRNRASARLKAATSFTPPV